MITSHVYGEERLWTCRNLCVSLPGSHTQSLTCAARGAGSSSLFLSLGHHGPANRSRVDPAGRGRRGDGADAGDDDDAVCVCWCWRGTHLERRLDFVADGHFGDGCRLAGVVFAMDTMEVGCREEDSGCRGSCGRKGTQGDSMKVVQHDESSPTGRGRSRISCTDGCAGPASTGYDE